MSIKEELKNKLDEANIKITDSLKKRIDEKKQDYELKKLFNPKKRIEILAVDFENKLFSVNSKKNKSGVVSKSLSVATLGVSTAVKVASKNSSERIYNFNDMLKFELLEDDFSVSSGGLGRAVAGAAISPVGSLVGAITGKKKTKKVIHSLILKIYLNDESNPCFLYDFIDSPLKKDSKKYQQIFLDAQEITSLLNLILHKNNNNNIEQ